MTEESNTDRRIKRFEKYQENANSQRYYAVQRFDLLVIAVATSGIILSLNIIKVYLENPDIYSLVGHVLLKIAAGLFTVCIISNLLSQISAQKAYNNQSHWGQQNIFELEKDPRFDECEKKKRMENMDSQHRFTKSCNWISTVLLFLGLVILAVGIVFFA